MANCNSCPSSKICGNAKDTCNIENNPMINAISSISTKGYENLSEELYLIFKPILSNIMKQLK